MFLKKPVSRFLKTHLCFTRADNPNEKPIEHIQCCSRASIGNRSQLTWMDCQVSSGSDRERFTMGGGKLPQNPPPSDPYNRAVNFIHFFQIFVRKCAKYHNYTIISYLAENYDISNLQCNIRFNCFLEQKPRQYP